MFAIFSTVNPLSRAQAERLVRIERKLDLILDHLGLAYDDAAYTSPLPKDVCRLADEGQKIAAIKAHREATGSSLLDAKNAVEDYMAGR